MDELAPVSITSLVPILKEMQGSGMQYVSFDRVPEGYIVLGYAYPEEYGMESTSAYEYGFIPALDKASRQ